MIQKHITLLAIVGVVAGGLIFLAVARGDETPNREANQQFCDDVGKFTAALGELRDVNRNTPISELKETRELVGTTYQDMIESALSLSLPTARLDDLEEADKNLRSAVDGIEDEATLGEAIDSIRDEVQQVAIEVGKLLNDVGCGSGQGGQERSGE